MLLFLELTNKGEAITISIDERGLAVAAVAHETYVTDLVYRIIGHN